MANRYNDRERYGVGYEEDERYSRGSDYWRTGQGYGNEPQYRGSSNTYYDPYRNYGNSSYDQNRGDQNRGDQNRGDQNRGDQNRGYSGSSYDQNRGYSGSYNDQSRGYGGSSYDQNRSYSGSSYDPNRGYNSYDYGRYEVSGRQNEPYRRGYNEQYGDPYYQNRVYRGFNRGWEDRNEHDRGFWERAGDEVRSWFGDEEAARRRQQDETRSQYAGRGPKSYRRSDERIREDINDRLTGDYYLDAHDIDVSVSEGVVTLTGRVDNRRDKRRAEDLAEMVTGVTDVSNQLRVGQSTTDTSTGTDTTHTVRAKSART